MVKISIKKSELVKDLPLPSYATSGSAGVDLFAACSTDLVIAPGKRVLVPTGISVALPSSYEAQIRPRSGLALKHGVTVLNSPGTIDSDYRGEIAIILINHGEVDFTISRGMRIAQMIIAPVVHADWCQEVELQTSERGADGFGSTGA